MSHQPPGPDREHVFRSLYESVYPDLLRFVQRRSSADQVDDVIADACLVVWRRLDELPDSRDEARAWVFGITRNVLLGRHRGDRRRHALAVRLADPTTPTRNGTDPRTDPAADGVATRIDLGRAWHRLSPDHQEALALAVFERLAAPAAAAVLSISPVAFRLRLSRARRALRHQLGTGPIPDDKTPYDRSVGIQERNTAS
ncbi:DNA-directed RNA polymerase sigma-70 factor [Microlunatus endophyticus]|uniref:DNA-directed RNA polymerase sigma-70 factor n=1 Tax=Microlunatus endophyticus TaxID=1716077 RepID=A0A917W5G1_9ACTN|nr:sigma-70 family RNA polymerase sigma factor [Microlunatus endophyticus]GGL71398.1 DNA-directed RNA polymerase sigma-70 factor [Microlunatus endophyticus]